MTRIYEYSPLAETIEAISQMPSRGGIADFGNKGPLRIGAGSWRSAHCGSLGSAISQGPRARPYTLAAARGIGSHRSLIDPKERWFTEATVCRPLTGRAAVVLQLEQGHLMLSRRFSLFAAKLQEVPPEVSLAVDDDRRGRHVKPWWRARRLALRSLASAAGR
jgi:hypothetical protein